MFTLCPACKSVHPLRAADLAQGRGQVVCGHCGDSFSALDRLWDDYPDAERPPAAANDGGQPPTLGDAPGSAPAEAVAEVPASAEPAMPVRWPWLALVGALGLATLFNLGWILQDKLPREGGVARMLQGLSVPGFEPPAAYRDPARMHLVTRDIHAHPTRAGVLVLSATFVNLGDAAQPFPQLAVTLFDTDNQPIAARLFRPADYLRQAPEADRLLAPDEHVPVLLEFADPGDRATGFDLQFR